MINRINIKVLDDKFKKKFFLVSFYNKYNYRQYMIKRSAVYTFFLIVNFLYKLGFIKR